MSAEHFADRLFDAVQSKRSQIVVGLDPRIDQLPPYLLEAAVEEDGRSPEAAAAAIAGFNRAVLDAVCDVAAAVKVQIAFYEVFGCAGMLAYAQAVADAHERGLIVIGDVKRSDIGSTAEAYAMAHLPGAGPGEWDVPSDLHVDVVTVNPLLGSDGVKPFVARAAEAGCGVFALVKTSNPSSAEVQDLECGGRPVYERLAALVAEWGSDMLGESGYSLLGAVVGATFPEQLGRLRGAMPHAPLLVPGFGAQGGGVEDVVPAFDGDGLGAVVNSSRGIIFAWQREPYASTYGVEKWLDAVRAAAEDMRGAIWDATHAG